LRGGRSGSQKQTKRFGTEGSKDSKGDWVGVWDCFGSFDEIAFARGDAPAYRSKQRGLEQKVAEVTKGAGLGDLLRVSGRSTKNYYDQ
jgi:hypothetical protein